MSALLDTLLEVNIEKEENFLKIKETLTRIGVASRREQKLIQSCHILHKKGKYYITHFKELFLLDGRESEFTIEDKQRRNTIANLLQDWDLLKIVNPEKFEDKVPLGKIKIIPYKEKSDWILEAKYTIGKKLR